MRSPPDSPTRPALINTTNACAPDCSFFTLPATGKRIPDDADERDTKRLKLSTRERHGASDTSNGDSDVEMEDSWVPRARVRRRAVFAMRDAAMTAASSTFLRQATLSTRSILQSFVSSHRSDAYRCHSVDESSFNTLPYACAYSHAAKGGSTPLLAIATEQGSVHIINTSRRDNWDCEPQRTILHPHVNGIFDIKWSPSDTLLATASGDHSVRIMSTGARSEHETLHVLRGHAGTVKCIAWDPDADSQVLCAGGRDGGICVWDLRAGENRTEAQLEDRALAPVITIPGAHEDGKPARPRGRRVTAATAVRSVTSIVYASGSSYTLISSGSYDGVLRQWDLRLPSSSRKPPKSKSFPKPLLLSTDPTTLHSTRRPRGITMLVPGTGPSASLLFALGTDSRVHTYALPTLEPLSGQTVASGGGDLHAYTHEWMQTNSFYVRAALSPCGRWLASGNAAAGRVFLFDVSRSAAGGSRRGGHAYGCGGGAEAVVLRGQKGEVGALDWAEGMLATCADDTTVRVWRPDVEVYKRCLEDTEEMKWQWSWSEAEQDHIR